MMRLTFSLSISLLVISVCLLYGGGIVKLLELLSQYEVELSSRTLVNPSTKLKLLSKDEVELAAALCTKYLVEAVSPVDTHHTHHWEVDTDA